MESAHLFFLLLVYVFVNYSDAANTRRLQSTIDNTSCRRTNKGFENCIRISQCKPIFDFLASKDDFTKEEREILTSYQCGYYENEPTVCCPNTINLGSRIDDEGCRTPDSGIGNCISIKNCKILFDYIDQNDNISDGISNEIRKYFCGNDGDLAKVCCPSKLPSHWIQTTNSMRDDSQHRNIKLLPSRDECGKSSSSNRIVNGNITELFEYPWAVVLKYKQDFNPFSCGASLISKRYVLTAAHCIRSTSKLIGARLGEYNFTTERDCVWDSPIESCSPPHQDFDISDSDAVVHEGYDAKTFANDIALIRLPTDANINAENIFPVCLPLSLEEKSKPLSEYTVIGWGATETSFSSKVLLKVTVPHVETSKCAQLYAARIPVTDNQLCAGGKNQQDSCGGDSGGPLSTELTLPNNDLLTMQYGVVSFGPKPCGRERFPVVYTRVSKYTNWILDNMRE